MIDRSKKIIARFYALSSGRRPVRDWLLGLPRDDRRIIGRDIQQVEFGWPIGMPYCRPLGQGLWEVRSNLAGNRMARVIFCITDGEMIPAARIRKEDPEDATTGHRACANAQAGDRHMKKAARKKGYIDRS